MRRYADPVRAKVSTSETPAWTTLASGGTYALFRLLLILRWGHDADRQEASTGSAVVKPECA